MVPAHVGEVVLQVGQHEGLRGPESFLLQARVDRGRRDDVDVGTEALGAPPPPFLLNLRRGATAGYAIGREAGAGAVGSSPNLEAQRLLCGADEASVRSV